MQGDNPKTVCLPQQNHLQVQAQVYINLFEELLQKDVALFVERHLQDMLLCRAQAPKYSIKDEDFHTVWDHRLTELLDKRQLYLQVSCVWMEWDSSLIGIYVGVNIILS